MRIVGNPPSGGKKPTTPTIGTASDGGTGTTVSVAFTPSTYIGKGTITYTATSSPGSLTGTGSGSPITVSGLTTGTAYTFTVNGTTNYGVVSDNSAASNSVTPASPSSFESIASATPSGVNTFTFSSIPSTYKHLQIRAIAKTAANNNEEVNMRFNGVTTSSYASHYLTGDGNAVSSGATQTTSIYEIFRMTGQTNATGVYTASIIDIIDYASSSKNKTVFIQEGYNAGGGTSGSRSRVTSGLFNSTTAISSITIFTATSTNFASNTVFALYGIKG